MDTLINKVSFINQVISYTVGQYEITWLVTYLFILINLGFKRLFPKYSNRQVWELSKEPQWCLIWKQINPSLAEHDMPCLSK